MVSHKNICTELIKPCIKLSKDLSHQSVKRVLVKGNNLKSSHRVYNSKPTNELCLNDQLIKCSIDSGSDRTIIKFEKLLE